MQRVPLSVLQDLLTQHNPDLPPEHIFSELELVLLGDGYAVDVEHVTPADAVGILEQLDTGIIESTREQRAALTRLFLVDRLVAG